MSQTARELDAQVAVHVFGRVLLGYGTARHGECPSAEPGPDPMVLARCCCDEVRGWREETIQACITEHGWTEAQADGQRAHGREGDGFGHTWHCMEIVPWYAESIEDAWRVVEKLDAIGFYPQIDRLHDDRGERFWRCEAMQDGSDIWADGGTAPLAICLAALAAVARDNARSAPVGTPIPHTDGPES